jgi:hypothetical protein
MQEVQARDMRVYVCDPLSVQAALQLGMRFTRHPTGYWDSLDMVDAELDAFIAGASWGAAKAAAAAAAVGSRATGFCHRALLAHHHVNGSLELCGQQEK